MFLCMRTTLNLDDDLLAEAKQRAARGQVTLTVVIEDALRESFGRRPAAAERPPVKLSTAGRGWLRPGVDLDDSAALLAHMERESDPS